MLDLLMACNMNWVNLGADPKRYAVWCLNFHTVSGILGTRIAQIFFLNWWLMYYILDGSGPQLIHISVTELLYAIATQDLCNCWQKQKSRLVLVSEDHQYTVRSILFDKSHTWQIPSLCDKATSITNVLYYIKQHLMGSHCTHCNIGERMKQQRAYLPETIIHSEYCILLTHCSNCWCTD